MKYIRNKDKKYLMKKRIQYIIIIYLILIFIKNSIGVENIAQNNSPEFNISILLFKKILYDPAGSDNLFEEFLVSKNIKSYKIKELMPEYSKYFEDNTNTSTNTTHNNEVSTKINSYYEPVKIN